MKSFIILMVLCTALFITDAAPIRGPWSPFLPFQSDRANEQSDEMMKKIFGTIFSTIGNKLANGEIQSNNELAKTFLDGFSSILSAAGKKAADPNKKQMLGLFDSLLNVMKNKLGNGQHAEAEYLNPLVPHAIYSDKTAAMVEEYMKLSDEAKEQFWGPIVGSLVSGAIGRAFKG